MTSGLQQLLRGAPASTNYEPTQTAVQLQEYAETNKVRLGHDCSALLDVLPHLGDRAIKGVSYVHRNLFATLFKCLLLDPASKVSAQDLLWRILIASNDPTTTERAPASIVYRLFSIYDSLRGPAQVQLGEWLRIAATDQKLDGDIRQCLLQFDAWTTEPSPPLRQAHYFLKTINAGNVLNPHLMAHWLASYTELIQLAQVPQEATPPSPPLNLAKTLLAHILRVSDANQADPALLNQEFWQNFVALISDTSEKWDVKSNILQDLLSDNVTESTAIKATEYVISSVMRYVSDAQLANPKPSVLNLETNAKKAFIQSLRQFQLNQDQAVQVEVQGGAPLPTQADRLFREVHDFIIRLSTDLELRSFAVCEMRHYESQLINALKNRGPIGLINRIFQEELCTTAPLGYDNVSLDAKRALLLKLTQIQSDGVYQAALVTFYEWLFTVGQGIPANRQALKKTAAQHLIGTHSRVMTEYATPPQRVSLLTEIFKHSAYIDDAMQKGLLFKLTENLGHGDYSRIFAWLRELVKTSHPQAEYALLRLTHYVATWLTQLRDDSDGTDCICTEAEARRLSDFFRDVRGKIKDHEDHDGLRGIVVSLSKNIMSGISLMTQEGNAVTIGEITIPTPDTMSLKGFF